MAKNEIISLINGVATIQSNKMLYLKNSKFRVWLLSVFLNELWPYGITTSNSIMYNLSFFDRFK